MTESESDKWPPPQALRARPPRRLARTGLLILIVVCLTLYLFGYRPAASRVGSLADSLKAEREQLTSLELGSLAAPGDSIRLAQHKLEAMTELVERIERQTTLHPNLHELLRSPFRVLEFEQRRFTIFRDLNRLADEADAQLPSDFALKLPAYSSYVDASAHTWLYLEFFNHSVRHLLQSGAGVRIDRIEALPEKRFRFEANADDLLEIGYDVEVRAASLTIANFLNTILPESTAKADAQSAFFISRLELHGPENTAANEPSLDLITLRIHLSGFATVPNPNN
ncbi:MAG: hypothetical protein EA353_11280 [Puniceicoccaceae bacterium]|nr:MAG: hypothetical protein EA353_11280 [Puniceicoccaceae bacterium]